MPDFESGRHPVRTRSPPVGQSGSMQLSSHRSSQACTDAHVQTGLCKDDTLDESVSVLKVDLCMCVCTHLFWLGLSY